MTTAPLFFVGVHDPHNASKVLAACISVRRLMRRKRPFTPPFCGWIMDSGAFTEISQHGRYRFSPAQYAAEAAKWVSPDLLTIVAQDYMCEPFILKKTGLTVREHQRLTVERYDALRQAWESERVARGAADWPPIMPVLQGWTEQDYLGHVELYGDRLRSGMWVGVGSVCKRQGKVSEVEGILRATKALRPDLRLHGFGVKLTALRSDAVRSLLYSADSMAWSFSARKQGRDGNDISEAIAFVAKVLGC